MPPAGVIHVFNNHNVEPKTSKFWCDTKATSGPTMLSTLVAIRTLKLSNIGTGQFLDGRPLRNSWCSWHGFESRHCWMAKLTSNSAWPLVTKCLKGVRRGPCKFKFIVQPQIIVGNFFLIGGWKFETIKFRFANFRAPRRCRTPTLTSGRCRDLGWGRRRWWWENKRRKRWKTKQQQRNWKEFETQNKTNRNNAIQSFCFHWI